MSARVRESEERAGKGRMRGGRGEIIWLGISRVGKGRNEQGARGRRQRRWLAMVWTMRREQTKRRAGWSKRAAIGSGARTGREGSAREEGRA